MLAKHKGLLLDLARQHIKRFPPGVYSVDDLMQIAKVALWQATQKYQGDLGAQLQTFVYACVNNALLTEYNTLACQKRGEGKWEVSIDAPVEDTYQVTVDKSHRLNDFMETLSAEDKEVLTMRLHGYTATEISNILNKNYRNVQRKILKLKKQLGEYLEV